jgi:hypothetical protein
MGKTPVANKALAPQNLFMLLFFDLVFLHCPSHCMTREASSNAGPKNRLLYWMKLLDSQRLDDIASRRPSLPAACCLFLAALLTSASHAQPPVPHASDLGDVRQAYEAFRHQLKPERDGWSARNPGQRWTTSFDARGFLARPDTGSWTWGLELTGYGTAAARDRGEASTRAIAGRAAVSFAENRIHYRWDDTLTEWFLNDSRGLEQGWTLSARPGGGEGPLQLTLRTRGPLHPAAVSDPRQLSFFDAAGVPVLTYGGLKAWDADGVPLDTRFETVPDQPGAFRILVEDAAARYPVTIDPLAQQAYLKATNPEPGDVFGVAVAISGNTALIGATGESSAATGVNGNQASNAASRSGAAYVFVRENGIWTFQAYLKASNTGADDEFGSSVDLDGNTAVIGASGEDSAATGVNGNQVSNAASESGAAYVFVRSGSTWSQQAFLKASNTGSGDSFGRSVAISGNLVVVGAPGEDSAATGVNGNQASNTVSGAGAAYIFGRSGTFWSQQAYLKASNPDSSDLFGGRVAVSGNLIAVGAALEDSAATGVNGNQASDESSSSGAVYVFGRLPLTNSWSQRAYLKASNTGAGDGFGSQIALSGDTLVVGAPLQDGAATGVNGSQFGSNAEDSGAVYVFATDLLGFTWSQQAYLKASNTGAGDRFGRSVALSGDILVVGAPEEDSPATGVNGSQGDDYNGIDSGAAYVFTRVGTSWWQQAYLKPSHSAALQYSGSAVAISGDSVMVGAWADSSSASGVNGDPSKTGAPSSGAAHIFTGFAPPPLRLTGLQSVLNPNGTYAVTVTGAGQPAAPHSLQSSPAMAPGTWLNVGTTTSDSEGRFTFGPFVEPASRNRYFYRIEAN